MASAVPRPGSGIDQAPGGVRVTRDDPRAVVWMYGEHDGATNEILDAAIIEAGAVDDGADVVIDLTDVGFIDASTLGVICRARDRLGKRGSGLTVRAPQRVARRVIEMAGLVDLIEDETDASPDTPDRVPAALETWVEVPPRRRDARDRTEQPLAVDESPPMKRSRAAAHESGTTTSGERELGGRRVQ